MSALAVFTRRVVSRRLLVGLAVVTAVSLLAPLPAVTPPDNADAAVVARDKCGPILEKANGTRWKCSFVDNFTGRSLNREKWIVQQSKRSRFSTGLTCYTDSPDNISVRQGALRLTTLKGPLMLCRVRNAFLTRFTGGLVSSKGYFSQTYGRFEVRAKWPSTKEPGLHGGFWMYPKDQPYGRWPASGEIDVAEWWSSFPTLVMPSLHFNGRRKYKDSGRRCRVGTPGRFHRYTIVWRPTVMRFYIDGNRCFARAWEPEAPQKRPQPFDHPFSMILNMGVTKYDPESGITRETKFPSTFVVDYAKAWK